MGATLPGLALASSGSPKVKLCGRKNKAPTSVDTLKKLQSFNLTIYLGGYSGDI